MRAVQLVGHGGPEQLRMADMPVSAPAAGEVLIRISAASVNPVDWKIRMSDSSPMKFPVVQGADASGVVVGLGKGVETFKCGDAVVAFLDEAPQGGYAEYVAAVVSSVALKPAELTYREAAAYPLVAVTAWQMVELAKIAKGERVLVHGGSGGVGSMTVQIVKSRGAYVIATASARNQEYLKSIGADEAIDYAAAPFEQVAHDVDVVLDTVGGDTLKRSPAVLKKGGRLVTVTGRAPADACKSSAITCATAEASNNGNALVHVSDLIRSGALHINVEAVFQLEKAGEAQELNRAGHTRGKIVLDVRADAAEKS
jgi:NADPH:quinone reductase-like Zn-dependent oxidoreductase